MVGASGKPEMASRLICGPVEERPFRACPEVRRRGRVQSPASLDSKLLHISTDYVFDGMKSSPYIEEDPPRPLNAYGNSKLAGEHFVRCTNPRHFVVRVSGIYGQHPCRAKAGFNFVEMMLKFARERE